MTTILLPTGVQMNLADMNLHDLGQYYMYQMDMLGKADALMECLGLEGWAVGELLNPTINIDLKNKRSPVFEKPLSLGNAMPTHYNGSTWQGIITSQNGLKSYPPVEKMTVEQLRVGIEMQQQSLQFFMQATCSLNNLAENIKNATQPPESSMVLVSPYTA